tara:strand:+ start:4168 stop:4386 length:219 start_codon:yes stop_codon:yes gene_type:complete
MTTCNGCNCEAESVNNKVLKNVMRNVLCKRNTGSLKIALSIDLLFYMSTFSIIGYIGYIGYIGNKRLNRANL